MAEIKTVPKDEKIVVVDTKLERWFKTIATLFIGMAGMFGYQKMPSINEGTKINEAVQTVKNLSSEELNALQGVQIERLEKKQDERFDMVISAINELKSEYKITVKESEERTTKRMDEYGERQYDLTQRVSRIEALVPKARASSN